MLAKKCVIGCVNFPSPVKDIPSVALDAESDNFFVARRRFVGAGSLAWSEFDGALYVADSYGGKVYRYSRMS